MISQLTHKIITHEMLPDNVPCLAVTPRGWLASISEARGRESFYRGAVKLSVQGVVVTSALMPALDETDIC